MLICNDYFKFLQYARHLFHFFMNIVQKSSKNKKTAHENASFSEAAHGLQT